MEPFPAVTTCNVSSSWSLMILKQQELGLVPIAVKPVPPFVVGTVGSLSDAKVPEAMFVHLKMLSLIAGSVAGNLASGTVPEV
jgi:hypothetical protein